MQLQVKVLLFCLSMVLMTGPVATGNTGNTNNNPNNPQPTTTDITVVNCDQISMKIRVKATKAGNYYQCKDYTKLTGCDEVKNFQVGIPFEIKKEPSGKTKLLRFYMAKNNPILTGKYDQYEIDCDLAKIVKATKTIAVKSKGQKPKTIKNDDSSKVEIIFSLPSASLGEEVTMTFEEAKPKKGIIKMIKVSKCSVESTNGKLIEIYNAHAQNPGQELNIQKTTGSFEGLKFKAFRLLNQKDDIITFKCDVYICSNPQNCNPPGPPGHPQPYAASVGEGFDKVSGVLSVRIPQYLGSDVIPSSADKVCSYTNGFLLTVGAVVLQRQLRQN